MKKRIKKSLKELIPKPAVILAILVSIVLGNFLYNEGILNFQIEFLEHIIAFSLGFMFLFLTFFVGFALCIIYLLFKYIFDIFKCIFNK